MLDSLQSISKERSGGKMTQEKLVLVGAMSYTYIPYSLSPIKQGDIVTVNSQIAEHLRGLFYLDAAGGRREYFVSLDHPRAERLFKNRADEGRPIADAPAPKAERRAKKATPKKAPARQARSRATA
jgi:hypothetical protein